MENRRSAVFSAVATMLFAMIMMAQTAVASRLVSYTSYSPPEGGIAKPAQSDQATPVYNLYRRASPDEAVRAKSLGEPTVSVVIDRHITPASATDTLSEGTYTDLVISGQAIVYVQGGLVEAQDPGIIEPGALVLVGPGSILAFEEGARIGAPGQDLVQVLGPVSYEEDRSRWSCGLSLDGPSTVDETVVAGFNANYGKAGMGIFLNPDLPLASNTVEVNGLYATDNDIGCNFASGPVSARLQNCAFWNNDFADFWADESFQVEAVNCRFTTNMVVFNSNLLNTIYWEEHGIRKDNSFSAFHPESRLTLRDCALPTGFLYALSQIVSVEPRWSDVVRVQETQASGPAQIWPTARSVLPLDFDLGGSVEVNDFRLLASVFGQENYYNPPAMFGDIDKDNHVKLPDIVLWGQSYTGLTAVRDWPADFRGRQLLLAVLEYPEIVDAARADAQLGPALAKVVESLHPTAVEENAVLPLEFGLEQNYPNPFNSATTITYSLPTTGQTSLIIYNITGQMVRTLWNGPQSAGRHTSQWDGADGFGQPCSSGLYFYQLQAVARTETRQLLLVK